MHEATSFVLQASFSSFTRRVTCSASFVLIMYRAGICQFYLHHFSYPDSLLHWRRSWRVLSLRCRRMKWGFAPSLVLSRALRVSYFLRLVQGLARCFVLRASHSSVTRRDTCSVSFFINNVSCKNCQDVNTFDFYPTGHCLENFGEVAILLLSAKYTINFFVL